ncbi:hypothetical protein M422DRAFT_47067 [Sphaerobolus stellatus SS14]|uniref:K Homology domain-containing protein n=1 Tax=Sphaerobolus stellatus (strain SS14) TaxID=990650 RepID=A0A0C9VE07_SPHS4|nr:hypothetical protein M422DRAFT_47067 [Sphaerobolus stellatus SS14]
MSPSTSPVRDAARSGSPADSRSASPTPANGVLTLRALVTTKEAGIIIGKGGKNVADIREQSGVKAGVSKVVPGVHERVLTVSGSVEAVAKAYTLIINQLLANAPPSPSPVTPTSPNGAINTSISLLISHNLMGTIIGRNGLKIKAIQDGSGARMVAEKEMLPQSTERIVVVQGTPDSIGRAIEEIGKCLLEDWERGVGTVLFHPGASEERERGHGRRTSTAYTSGALVGTPRRSNGDLHMLSGRSPSPGNTNGIATPTSPSNLRTQNISIPSDMVGCIIGRSGSKITEIRRLSGSKISIAKTPHDETGERMFTIIGTSEANEKALFLLYNQLEMEKERRVGREGAAEVQE